MNGSLNPDQLKIIRNVSGMSGVKDVDPKEINHLIIGNQQLEGQLGNGMKKVRSFIYISSSHVNLILIGVIQKCRKLCLKH